jgi:hypothetical protein
MSKQATKVKVCPYCKSRDLDEFEDETGSYCNGCSSNVFKPAAKS